jgi:hypothetical protein
VAERCALLLAMLQQQQSMRAITMGYMHANTSADDWHKLSMCELNCTVLTVVHVDSAVLIAYLLQHLVQGLHFALCNVSHSSSYLC